MIISWLRDVLLPSPTAIHQPYQELGEMAAHLLIPAARRFISGSVDESGVLCSQSLAPKLIVRQST